MSALVPMSGKFPLPPHPTTPIAESYRSALEDLGYNPYPCVSFHASVPYVNPYGVTVNQCAYDGWCVNYVCETGAKGNGGYQVHPCCPEDGQLQDGPEQLRVQDRRRHRYQPRYAVRYTMRPVTSTCNRAPSS